MSDSNSTTLWDVPPEKTCAKCKKSLPLESFGRVKGKVRSYCRKCHLAANFVPDERLEKVCPCCQETKAMSEFNRLGNRYQSICRACQNSADGKRREEDKQSGKNIEINRKDYRKRKKWIKLKTKYGISKEQYEALLLAQNNLCAICLEPEKEIDKQQGTPLNLSVDHDHKTGKVRGLLCRRCNIGIGRLKESVENLQRAIEYLKRYS